MPPRYLLDTHILVRALLEPKRLTRDQRRVIETAVRRREPLALSATSLIEVALLWSEDQIRLTDGLDGFFGQVESNPIFTVLPFTFRIASEFALLRNLRDPSDRAIVATARVHRLLLLTCDGRIIDSNLVPVVE